MVQSRRELPRWPLADFRRYHSRQLEHPRNVQYWLSIDYDFVEAVSMFEIASRSQHGFPSAMSFILAEYLDESGRHGPCRRDFRGEYCPLDLPGLEAMKSG